VRNTRLTDREQEIMAVLWERGSATVAEVRGALSHNPAHTTVLTLLRVLETKGHVSRKREGKRHRYYPLLDHTRARRAALRRMLQTIFGGKAELLMVELLEEEGHDVSTLIRLQKMVEDRLREELE
jgi:BlaI family transcriptional regulator, penicillinase repressor